MGLTARAFGADEVVLSGDRDPSALETWDSVTERFGGNFESRFEESPLSVSYTHLTLPTKRIV